MSEWVTVEEFDFSLLESIKIQKRRTGNPGRSNRQHRYKDIVCAFDIETSKIPFIDQSAMYIWMFQIGREWPTIIGRDWGSFQQLVDKLGKTLCKEDSQKYVVYVHNLSYEFQFLAGIYPFRDDEVFAIKARKVAKCYMADTLEFRCSYLHSNMSLEKFCENMRVEHVKQSAQEFDHTRYRTPETVLTDRELRYAINDVKGLVECIYTELENDGDTLYTIPITSTGYVRRDTRRAMRHVPKGYVRDQLPSLPVYRLLREAFRGGNTHANRYYADTLLHDVKSADYSSSYPAVQVCCEFPVSKFIQIESRQDVVMDRMCKRGRAILTRISLWDVRLRDNKWGCPYIPRDNCRRLSGALIDNGRVISCDHLEMTVTDVDLRIIMDEYDYSHIEFSDTYQAKYGKLPPAYVDNVNNYFTLKTALKGDPEREYEYMKSKNKINAIYGMSAQDPIKQSIIFAAASYFMEDTRPIAELLQEFNTKKAFLPYQWGVWTTAWARYRLEQAIRMCGDGLVYVDTDSVKYLGDPDFTAFNAERQTDAAAHGAVAQDRKGVTHYMGVLEQERTYKRFKTLGAKKYAYEYADGQLHITIAGVNKKKGAAELARAGGIEMLTEDFVFVDGGGTETVYNDEDFGTVWINGVERRISRNVYIRPSTYTLGLGVDYKALLAGAGLRSIGEALRKMYNMEVEWNVVD